MVATSPPGTLPTPARDGEGLTACPYCDALNREVEPPIGGRVRCGRCGEVMMTNRPHALDRTLAAAFAVVVLMVGAVMFPFLELHTFGLTRKASVLDAALAFSDGLTMPLAVAVGMLIVVIPLMRAFALAYVILPVRLGRPPAPGAHEAFRLAGALRPWSMAEVFIIGVVVALVKVAGMASVSLGPAFWAMACMVLLVVLEATSLDDWSIWRRLDRTAPR
ncbi:paraquat-inducible protein A [Amaricoccus sp.]|uniref:paraquat-inducible protein A n=1 Tax=Amaricoccus sp. TaxID=1872485 RepID=UPI001B5D0633|nr:paraquat-inducible protein A [Amaricoccus sp.]MBP7242614.1 paraquat-inducible protein A [Amaricoccus sp.]